MSHFSQRTPRRVNFALVLEHTSSVTENTFSETSTRCLLLGMKEPTQTPLPRSASSDARSAHLTSAEELTRDGKFHLTLLASLTQRETVKAIPEPFPEWLVLFGLVYDARHIRIIAYVPYRRKSDEIDCATYIVDKFAFHSSVIAGAACELVLERLHFLSALTALRRHVHCLSKSLFTTIGPRDGIRRTDHHSSFLGCSACDWGDADDSESLERCASPGSSQHCSSEYSTCPSSVHPRGLNDVTVLELSSSCSSLFSSACSTCSSLLESASSSSTCSEDCNDMEPSTLSLSQRDNKNVTCLYKLTETTRREIIAWAQQVIPTEHPVKDNYRMVIYQGSRTLHQVHDRHDQLYTGI